MNRSNTTKPGTATDTSDGIGSFTSEVFGATVGLLQLAFKALQEIGAGRGSLEPPRQDR